LAGRCALRPKCPGLSNPAFVFGALLMEKVLLDTNPDLPSLKCGTNKPNMFAFSLKVETFDLDDNRLNAVGCILQVPMP
jgi:hypothetical protein